MKLNKVLQVPALPCDPNDFYFVKNGNFVDCYLSDSTGDTLYKVFDCKNFPSIEGPNAVVPGVATNFTITDFDLQAEYIITAVNGTATRVNDVITFTSDLVSSSYSFTINGLVVSLIEATINTAPTFDVMVGGRLPYVVADGGIYIDEYFSSKIAQADGKLIISMTVNDALHNKSYVISRLNTNGSIDTTYGTNGYTVIESNLSFSFFNDCIFFDATENLFVLKCGYDGKLVLSKYSTIGILDTTFGTSGKLDIELPIEYVTDTVYTRNQYIQADGKVLVCGYIYVTATGYTAAFLLRLNQNGSIDNTFGTSGFTISDIPTADVENLSICQDTNNNIFVLQYYSETVDTYLLLKYTSLGILDTSFGISGGVTIGIVDGVYSFILVQSDDKLIVTGAAPYISNTAISAISVLRFNTDGTIDTTYGVDGEAQRLVYEDGNYVYNSILSTNDTLFVTGETDLYALNLYTGYCAKFDAYGDSDNTFGNNGVVITNVESQGVYPQSIHITASNQIYIFSDTATSSNNWVSIFKLNSNGSYDNNYSPLLTNTINALLLYVPDSIITLSATAKVNDVELSALNGGLGNYDGSSIVIQRNVLANTDDHFNAINGLSFVTGSVILNAITIGTYTNADGILTILFNANATTALVNECLQSITYQRTGSVDVNGSDWDIAYLFNDGSEASNGALTVQSLVSFRYAYGAAVDEFCVGVDNVRTIADGYGGLTDIVIEANSISCGYIPFVMPTVNDIPNPTVWVNTGLSTTLSPDGLTISGIDGTTLIESNAVIVTGKWYWEITSELHPVFSAILTLAGVGLLNTALDQGGGIVGHWLWGDHRGSKFINGVYTEDGVELWNSASQVIGLALDMEAGTLEYYIDGISTGIVLTGITPAVTPIVSDGTTIALAGVTANFGATEFAFMPPVGYSRLNALEPV